MNPSAIKAKGRAAENQMVQFLSRWWPMVERRRLAGVADRGDIAGIPRTVIEVKSGARMDLPGWLRELEVEMGNDGAEFGCVAVKPRGTTDGAKFYCVMTGDQFVHLLRAALGDDS
jgi:hypothetical protein